MKNHILHTIQKVHDFESLVHFLRDTLNWPIPNDLTFAEITHDWSAVLELAPSTQARVDGVWQLRLSDMKFDLSKVAPQLHAADPMLKQQPWGIFLIQFENTVKLDACKTILRILLKKLGDAPKHNAYLPFWIHDKLLFICTTTDFQNIGFTCFRGKKGVPIVHDYISLKHFKLDAIITAQK